MKPWFNLWLLCILGTHNQAISSLILSGDDIRAISYSSIVASVVGLTLSWILIPKYQIGGVCIAFAVYMMIQMLFYYVYYWPVKMKINSYRVLVKCFLPFSLLGGALAIVVMNINFLENTFMRFFMKGGLFAILFISMTLCILSKNDREFFINIIKRRKQ